MSRFIYFLLNKWLKFTQQNRHAFSVRFFFSTPDELKLDNFRPPKEHFHHLRNDSNQPFCYLDLGSWRSSEAIFTCLERLLCPISLGNFTLKTSNYCLKNRALGFPGGVFIYKNRSVQFGGFFLFERPGLDDRFCWWCLRLFVNS